jgi:hypothetical protein
MRNDKITMGMNKLGKMLHRRKNMGEIEKEPVSCGRDLQKQRYIPQALERV